MMPHWSTLTPNELFLQLQHLPGLAFLDSSGFSSQPNPHSILAARPTHWLHGDLHSLEPLIECLQQNQTESPHLGALIGYFTYEGQYCFGVYPELLCYQHNNHTWSHSGQLQNLIQAAPKCLPALFSPFRASTLREDYESAVLRIQDYIRAGDIYQVNLCQKFTATLSHPGSLIPIYQALRAHSPAPMAAYLDFPHRQVLSSSPESFLELQGRHLISRPIKGTRPRHLDPIADAAAATELSQSEKERAELVMITDLLRNDLGQVCEFGSVHVDQMLSLESFPQVHHLVSTISGKLMPQHSALSALKACFPGGSITGAPKKRAMEIIQELETTPRGLYTGAIGYFDFNGDAHFNIAIRTLIFEDDQLHYHVGAGIVADSIARLEYEETLHKAAGMRHALSHFCPSSS